MVSTEYGSYGRLTCRYPLERGCEAAGQSDWRGAGRKVPTSSGRKCFEAHRFLRSCRSFVGFSCGSKNKVSYVNHN